MAVHVAYAWRGEGTGGVVGGEGGGGCCGTANDARVWRGKKDLGARQTGGACWMKNFIGLAHPKSRPILHLPGLCPSSCRTSRSAPRYSRLSQTHRPIRMPSIEHPTIKGKNTTISHASVNPWRGTARHGTARQAWPSN